MEKTITVKSVDSDSNYILIQQASDETHEINQGFHFDPDFYYDPDPFQMEWDEKTQSYERVKNDK